MAVVKVWDGTKYVEVGVGDHVLLDGNVHTDTVAQSVTRGSVIVGNGTPEWDELVIDVSGKYFRSDGTDPSWTALTIVDDPTPQLGGMLDVNGHALGDGTLELLKFVEIGSAVNEITVTNAATGDGPSVSATGDDANINLDLIAKGTGGINLSWDEFVGTIDTMSMLELSTAGDTGTTHFTTIGQRRARNTLASPSAIQQGDVVARSYYYGHDGSGYELGAGLSITAGENWDATHHGTVVTWSAIANGAGAGTATIMKYTGEDWDIFGTLNLWGDLVLYGDLIQPLRNSATAADGMELRLQRGRGTQASPSAILNGDYISQLTSHAYDGAGYDPGAEIRVTATENWATLAHGCSVEIHATADGAASPSKYIELLPTAKRLNIGGGTDGLGFPSSGTIDFVSAGSKVGGFDGTGVLGDTLRATGSGASVSGAIVFGTERGNMAGIATATLGNVGLKGNGPAAAAMVGWQAFHTSDGVKSWFGFWR